jgi:Protein of unknown function (DUF1592)/Protein of unknown function (DUF1588)/Protein of unknown function (DUF1587)/Protein of unknown function (DUF1585)/Protein of unknown function (DUF1595)
VVAAVVAAAFAVACGDSAPPERMAPEPPAPVGDGTPEPGSGAPPSSQPPAVAPPPAVPESCGGGTPSATFHRLNRTEYHNTVNDLLGTKLPLRDWLPSDSLLEGFDNHGDAVMSAPLLQRYLNLAGQAVAAALRQPQTFAGFVPCELGEPKCQRSVVEAFLLRAFRRPATAEEIDEHVGYFSVCDESPRAGLACALEAALISPKFLFRAELASDRAGGAGELGQHAIAERLAFFLWSTGPDARLLDLAEAGRLRDPATLAAEADRLLAVEAGRFVRPFTAGFPIQWLELDGLEAAAPSKQVFPQFDEDLRAAMMAESQLFFAHILTTDRSALELMQAPYTFANERLAAHYGIAGVRGQALARVETAGTPRGGVLTQAGFLTLTSSSEKTSIPQRARWVLRNLLCTTLNDPPPGAEEMVPAPPAELGLTSRESLERRTNQPACSGCHAVLNPVGFGLEMFDGIGATRTTERGKPIDTSGVLPTGETFTSTEELRALLAKDARFPACLTRKLLTYALGRRLEGACDEATVRVLADEFARDGYRLRRHVIRIVQSGLFRTARRTLP